MRRDSTQPTIVWNAAIDLSTHDAFESRFPVNGSRTWAITTGLEKFLELIERSPSTLNWAHADIQRMLVNPTPDAKREINLRIPSPFYDRFNKLLPEFGATTWFIRTLISALVAKMDERDINLEELVESAIASHIQH